MKNLVLVFVIAFAFSTTAMAVDIAISTQANWWSQGAADREMQEIVDNVTAVSVELFSATEQDALASWVADHTGDGLSDLLILCGQFPDTIYAAGNSQTDGSLAELFLDDGNTIINTGDYLFYVVNGGGGNAAGGLQNMMDISGITMWDPVPVTVTPDGQEFTPSLGDLSTDRPFHLDELEGDWEVELALAQNDAGTRADPVIVVNTDTGGRLGVFYQTSGRDDDPRGEVISEWINNWYIPNVAGGGGNPFARRPDPEDGAMLEATWVNLSWRPGFYAVSHDVYLGDNFDDVNNGAADTFVGNQGSDMLIVGFAGFPIPDGLVPGTTYYWRIDEVNDANAASPWKGDVWSFWIPPKKAYEAVPVDKTQFVTADVTLEWTAGFNAKLHTVYFGDNFDEVDNASGGAAQATTTFAPGTLELDKTYYWRVDEFDPPATHKGDVWSFRTLPDIPVTDPNLVGWWKFEAGSGAKVIDFSGHGNHGDIVDNVLWVPGQFNLALEFLGDNKGHVELPAGMVTTASGSVTMWVSTDLTTDEGMFWYGTETGGDGFGGDNEIHINVDDPGLVMFFIEGATDINIRGPQLAGAGWNHVAATWDQADGCRLYFNGVQVDFAGHNNTVVDLATIRLGRPVSTGNGNRYHDGLMDDVRLFNHAISAAQVQEIMSKGEDPLKAGAPNPGNGSVVGVDEATSLNFSAGDTAASHDVYFGTDRDAVAGADNSAPEFRGNQAGTSLSLAGLVEFGGGDYYWRIDEIGADGTVRAGTIWKFTVPDYLIVDNFDSYDNVDPLPGEPGINRIFDKWIDGFGTTTNGALVGNDLPPYAEQGIIHGGIQSMIYRYDNANKTSEATLTLAKRNWTAEGVTKLSLWFRGDSGNAADRMFVALNGSAVVYHDDASATQTTGWNEWVIDLTAFAGVDLTNVNTITIGIGTKGSPAAGGTGTMYFDDIRLIR